MTGMEATAPGPAPERRWPVPTSLSPSRVQSFTSCPLAFRFVSVEHLGDPPTIHTTRGTIVHRALELAYLRPPEARTGEAFAAATEAALDEYRTHPDVTLLDLDDEGLAGLEASCRSLVANYLTMEDPTAVAAIGLELRLSAQVGNLQLRGIIDRLELRDDGLVVSDYKTGRPPSVNWEGRSLDGVNFYALLCQEVFGQLPVAVRLLYLSTGEVIETVPSERSARFVATRTSAVWKAVERACQTGQFQPRPGALCKLCAFQRWCPAFGGDAERAHAEAPAALGLVAA